MAHVQFMDEIVKEYLLFRGFVASVKSFDADLKNDKDKGFRVDKIVDQLVQSINTHDLSGLRELWAHLDLFIFSKLEQHFGSAVKKFENSLLKYYLVTAVSAGKMDKVTEFLTKMVAEIQGQSEWREWFMLPYTPKPEENPSFSAYFSRQWQDTLLASLHNFLATIFHCLPQPALSKYESEAAMLKWLQEENASLKLKIAQLENPNGNNPSGHQSRLTQHTEKLNAPTPLMDDFYIIPTESTDNAIREARGLRGLIRHMGGSPVLGKKQIRSSSQN